MSELEDKPKRRYCEDKLATRAIMYSDTVLGKEVHRDDLWAVTTEELNEVHLLRQREAVLREALEEIKSHDGHSPAEFSRGIFRIVADALALPSAAPAPFDLKVMEPHIDMEPKPGPLADPSVYNLVNTESQTGNDKSVNTIDPSRHRLVESAQSLIDLWDNGWTNSTMRDKINELRDALRAKSGKEARP